MCVVVQALAEALLIKKPDERLCVIHVIELGQSPGGSFRNPFTKLFVASSTTNNFCDTALLIIPFSTSPIQHTYGKQ